MRRLDGSRAKWDNHMCAIAEHGGNADDIVTQDGKTSLDPTYAALFDVLADAALVIDAGTGCILDANTEALRTFGYSLDEIRLLCAADLSEADDGAGNGTPAGLVDASSGIPASFEWRSRRMDGHLLWMDVRAKRIVWGERACVFALLRDITARKEMEERLRTLREALDDGGSAVLIADRHGEAIYLNVAFGLLFGYTQDCLQDVRLEALFADVQQGKEIIEGVIMGGQWDGEVVMIANNRAYNNYVATTSNYYHTCN